MNLVHASLYYIHEPPSEHGGAEAGGCSARNATIIAAAGSARDWGGGRHSYREGRLQMLGEKSCHHIDVKKLLAMRNGGRANDFQPRIYSLEKKQDTRLPDARAAAPAPR